MNKKLTTSGFRRFPVSSTEHLPVRMVTGPGTEKRSDKVLCPEMEKKI